MFFFNFVQLSLLMPHFLHLQLDKPESTASSMKKSVSTFLDQVSTVLNPSPDDEDEEAVVIHGTDVVPLTRLQVGKVKNLKLDLQKI